MINQVHISAELEIKFGDNFRNKWNLSKYNNVNEPSVFFGLYTDKDIEAFKSHKSISIVVWGGVDKLHSNTVNLVKSKCEAGNCYEWNSPMLINNKLYSLPVRDYSKFTPVTLGDKIYTYKGWLGNRQDYFRWNDVILPLINHYGKDRIIYADNIEMPELIENYYKKCFVYIKPVRNGGCTQMWELAHMGRTTIGTGWGNYSFFKECNNNFSRLIELIDEQSKHIGKIRPEIANIAKNSFIDNRWLSLDFWKNKN